MGALRAGKFSSLLIQGFLLLCFVITREGRRGRAQVRLAGDADEAVRGAVAGAAGRLVGALRERGGRAAAAAAACGALQARLPGGWGALRPWRGAREAAAQGAEAAAAAPAVGIGAEDMAALCTKLLTEEPAPHVQVVCAARPWRLRMGTVLGTVLRTRLCCKRTGLMCRVCQFVTHIWPAGSAPRKSVLCE
jgi:hypothetical protein